MSIDVNDEILQDFLVEAGEILERLDEVLPLGDIGPSLVDAVAS